MGWGKLGMRGEIPRVRGGVALDSLKGREKRRLGPSDVVFPSSSSSLYPGEEEGEGEGENENENGIQNKPKPQKVSFTYTATWIYYGISIDETGKEILRECSQIPLSAQMHTGIKIDSEGKRESGNGKSGYEGRVKDEVEGEEDRWKIDL